MRTLTISTWVVAGIFIFWLIRSVAVYALGRPLAIPFGFNPDTSCSGAGIGVSCGAVSGFVTSLLSIALASVVFLFFRLHLVIRRYLVEARKRPRNLVPTAGSIAGTIVGRDELCRVIMADLHDRKNRRPHVLIGGMGTGKTAVLVRLTELLAKSHAIPVPIRLREAPKDLDFAELAKKRFISALGEGLLAVAEGERIWRRLLRDGRIVVLADGLEEALTEKEMEYERDNRIRLAIRRAREQRLPLVVASRPHDPLRGMRASVADLEPLSEEAALAYITEGRPGGDERQLDRIVETAEVAEAPLYLQVTRKLYRDNLLTDLDTQGVDRATLRLGLLTKWEQSIVDRHQYKDVPLDSDDRRAAIERLSALACFGLCNDSLEVDFDEAAETQADKQIRERIWTEVEERLRLIGKGDVDVRLAATWGAQLGLVETRPGGVRFQHSLMQAYLGSRLMDTTLGITEYVDKALESPDPGQRHLRPGREFLIALVLHSRRERLRLTHGTDRNARHRTDTSVIPGGIACRLYEAARDQRNVDEGKEPRKEPRKDIKVLNLAAAALEVVGGADGQQVLDIAMLIEQRWYAIRADDRTLEEGKLGFIRRFGEALRAVDQRNVDEGTTRAGVSAYAQLYQIGCSEPSYPIRLAVAQEIGAGGETAYRELAGLLAVPGGCEVCDKERKERAARSNPTPEPVRSGLRNPEDEKTRARGMRAGVISAWLAPLLIGTAGASQDKDLQRWAKEDLAQWLRHVGRDERRNPGERELGIFEQIALAQGFKFAANRRRQYPSIQPEARLDLRDQALRTLERSGYWFSQLALIHALTLWWLPDDNGHSFRETGSDPDAMVQKWLDVAARAVASNAKDNGRIRRPVVHPFVAAAAKLCSRALETGHPERFIWIDESGVVARVGSRFTGSAAAERAHHLWIPPSTGWSALDPRAQQLVADVLLLQNLAEAVGPSEDVERRLDRANRTDLPPCFTQDRTPLAPHRTIGMTDSQGTRLDCASGCPFDLCPYPPMGAQPRRVELSEAFCRRQRTLLRRRQVQTLRRTAPWQGIWAWSLRRFWGDMADRARGRRHSADLDAGSG
jgi:hypothetical protein